jgi:hypothetical protein
MELLSPTRDHAMPSGLVSALPYGRGREPANHVYLGRMLGEARQEVSWVRPGAPPSG